MKKNLLLLGLLLLYIGHIHSQVNGKVISPSFSSASQFVSSSFESSSSSIVLTNRSSYKLEIVNIFPDGINALTIELNNNFQPGESIKIPGNKSSNNGVRCFRSIAYKAADFDNENKSKGCELIKLEAKMGKEVCQAINGTNSCFNDAASVLGQNIWCDNQGQTNSNTSNDVKKSIEDAFNTAKENLSKSQKQEENTVEPTSNLNSSGSSSKDMFDKGIYAQYTDHDMENASYWYLKSAKDGYVEAMTKLSDYYSNETTANYDEAAHWWLLAYKNRTQNMGSLQNILNAFGQNKYLPTDYADIFSIFDITINEIGFEYLSHIDSSWVIHCYGKFYEKGQGCNVNLEKAFAIQLKNAKDGYIMSMVDLGMYYIDGKGTTKNYQEAFRWLTKAIDIDNSFRHVNTGVAMFALGYIYQHALGVDQNLGKAKEWYQKSSDALFEPAKSQLQKMGN